MAENDDPLLKNGSMAVSTAMDIVRLFNDSLNAMEARLGAKMDDNSRLASERWIKHDHDAERVLSDIEKRFEKVEEALDTHISEAKSHWSKEHDEEVAFNARLGPIKGTVAYARANWKSIALVVFAIAGLLGVSSSAIRALLGI